MIHSRVSWMCLPVERSITVSAPQRIAHVIFSTSSAMPEVTAELPMLALILTRKLRPMIIGSLSGWLMLAGMMARPRATSSRTNSGVISRPGMRGAERLAAVLAADQLGHLRAGRAGGAQRLEVLLPPDVLADRDELHLRRDDAAARVVHLRDVGPGLRAARPALQVEAQLGELRIVEPLAAVARGRPGRAPRCRRAPRSTCRATARGPGGCRSGPRDRCRGRRCRRRRSAGSSRRRSSPACRPARSRASARGCRRASRAT